MPTRCNRWFLLQILLLAQHVSGTIMPIIRISKVLYRWLLPVVFGALVFKLSVWCGAEGYASGLRAAETCWASSKFCNKNHLLHLVGILFPHINDYARTKSLQIESIFTPQQMHKGRFMAYSFNVIIWDKPVNSGAWILCCQVEVSATDLETSSRRRPRPTKDYCATRKNVK